MEQPKISWAPKVRRELVYKLYQAEKEGLADEYLLDSVGIPLLLRCESIVLISRGEVNCPSCNTRFQVDDQKRRGDYSSWLEQQKKPVQCPNESCSFEITPQAYRQSWRHKDLCSGKALSIFTAFYEKYPHARSNSEKMVLIDQLLHSFHWEATINLPNRSVANNLLEGSLKQVIDFLDTLTYGSPQKKDEWRQTIQLMYKRRRGEIGESKGTVPFDSK